MSGVTLREITERLEAERREGVARHARLLELARHNGIAVDLRTLDHVPGTWWQVPPLWQPIVGCMMARVA